MIDNPDEVTSLNKKQRQHMTRHKGGASAVPFLLQEGIPSVETWRDAIAEPVVYCIGSQVVGGVYRLHGQKGATDNLNAPGMDFEPLPFGESLNVPVDNEEHECCVNRFYVCGIVARLAVLAASQEKAEAMAKGDAI